jgi:hypothetical protein
MLKMFIHVVRFCRFSIAGLLVTVGICAFGLTCLLNASTSWAAATFSIILGMLVVALIGIVYRTGERRSFWVGFAICGWLYMVLTTGPWFVDRIGPRLVTTNLLDWAYPWLIPEKRRPSAMSPNSQDQLFQVHGPMLGEGLTTANLGVGSTAHVDVWVKKEGEKDSFFLLDDVAINGLSLTDDTLASVGLLTDSKEFAQLAEIQAAGMKVRLERHRPNPFAVLWATPPVSDESLRQVGHSWFGLLCAWIGGWVGRCFYVTSDPESRGV